MASERDAPNSTVVTGVVIETAARHKAVAYPGIRYRAVIEHHALGMGTDVRPSPSRSQTPRKACDIDDLVGSASRWLDATPAETIEVGHRPTSRRLRQVLMCQLTMASAPILSSTSAYCLGRSANGVMACK